MKHLRGKALYAYAAGIVDGEGTIGLYKRAGVKHTGLVMMVSIGNTNLWLLEFLKFNFGGSYGTSGKPQKLNHKPKWTWRLVGIHAAEFLRLISPYLQLKRQQAELALEFYGRRHKGWRTSEEKILDEADKILMASYNKKGVEPC